MDDFNRLYTFLENRVAKYNRPEFIADDPICIPHQFSKKQDIEIAGFFAATFAWGIRKTIIKKSRELMALMDNSPYAFCLSHSDYELKRFLHFAHRTFNSDDLLYFISFFRHHYQQHTSLEQAFFNKETIHAPCRVEASLNHFYNYFFSLPYVLDRTRKHVATPARHSACKRLNMFLRWMVRKDNHGVDFGIWKKIKPADLICPLDVHVARVTRNLGLLERKQNDWQAAQELTDNLKKLDASDPVRYDFALFSLGVIEKY